MINHKQNSQTSEWIWLLVLILGNFVRWRLQKRGGR